jgi:hypothetical protein
MPSEDAGAKNDAENVEGGWKEESVECWGLSTPAADF